MSVLDEKWHANEESGRIYDEKGSCVADLCAPEEKRAAHLRFFMRTQEAFRLLADVANLAPDSHGALHVNPEWQPAVLELLRAAGVLDDVSEQRGE